MKTVSNEVEACRVSWQRWLDIANDPKALEDRGKTREQAMYLANYFEGRHDGLIFATTFNT